MKIQLSKDLEPLRERALASLDQLLLQATPLDAIRARKLAEARQDPLNASTAPLLAAEANSRGIAIESLAAIVIEKGAASEAALLANELDRQARQARIRAARSPAEIADVLHVERK